MTDPTTRHRNARLADIIRALGWSQERLAARFRNVAAEAGETRLTSTQRSHVSMWIAGTKPSGNAPHILRETLARGLGHPVTMTEIGLEEDTASIDTNLWEGDTLAALRELGRNDLMNRRHLLDAAVYSTAALALPSDAWWGEITSHRHATATPARRATWADVEAIQSMTTIAHDYDQKYGGAHGRTAAVAYLTDDVIPILGTAGTDRLQKNLFSAAGELVYVIGWMAFDAGHHAVAQRYFILGAKLGAEAKDPALVGHILRAMAHQALDLHHPQQAARLSGASLHPTRYTAACHREKALLTVVHARCLATTGDYKSASTALLQAEDNLSNTTGDDTEPDRVWFFRRASLAHETARTLSAMGDLGRAASQFHRSVQLRNRDRFTRTHIVTLGYLAETYARRGDFDAACQTWAKTLDNLPTIQSQRVRDTIETMRHILSSIQYRRVPAALELQERLRDTQTP